MRILILFVIISLAFTIKAQVTFEAVIGTPTTNENVYYSFERDNGNFILVGTKEALNTPSVSPYIIEISKEGVILKENFLQDTSREFLYSYVLEFNSKLIVVGTLLSDYNTAIYDSIVISELDSNLNIINNVQVFIDSNSLDNGSMFYAEIFSDSILFISGYGIKRSQYVHNSFVFSLDTNYSVVNKQIIDLYQGIGDTRFYNFLFNKSDSHYYGYSPDGVCVLNADLTIDTLFFTSLQVRKTFVSQIGTKKYMLGLLRDNSAIKLYSLNNQFDTLSSQIISINQNYTYPAAIRSLSSNISYLYIGISDSINPNDIWWGMQNSKLLLTKIDTLGNTLWIKSYGKDGYYYLLYDVLATEDGGCLLSGCRYDYLSNSYQKDIFIIKVDSNGTTTWIKNIELPQIHVNLFPNPTSDFINLSIVSSTKTIKEITIYNISGKQVLHQQINSQQTQLNVSSLASGIYIIEGYTQGGEVFREKFVVE